VSFSGRNLDEVAHNSNTDLGRRSSIDNARSRLAHSGKLKRIARGLYESPRMDQLLGELSPDLDKVAAAMAGYQGICLQPTEAYLPTDSTPTPMEKDYLDIRDIFMSDPPTF
jgi:hypothetical protein